MASPAITVPRDPAHFMRCSWIAEKINGLKKVVFTGLYAWAKYFSTFQQCPFCEMINVAGFCKPLSQDSQISFPLLWQVVRLHNK